MPSQPSLTALPVRRRRGFTLIELMITVAVVSVLSAVALPSYRSSVRKSVRAEAQAFLLAVAGRQQQFLVDRRSFATSVPEAGIAVPPNVAANYTLSLSVVSGPPPTFSLSAAPKVKQADEPCGTLGIDQAGTKTAAVTTCW